MAKSTRALGSGEPLRIFQDKPFENIAPMTSHAPMPTVTKPQRSLTNPSPKVVLEPPSSSHPTCSPSKGRPSSSSSSSTSSMKPPLRPSQGNKLNMVPMARPAGKGPVTDSLLKKQPQLSKFNTGCQKSAIEACLDLGLSPGKENRCPIFPAPPTINFAIDSYYSHKATEKQGLLEPSPFTDTIPVAKTKAEDQIIPPWDSFPPIVDDGAKPQSSYAQLIGMAILRSPQRRLTLSQIYKWISESYSFYALTDAGWQNSIRHNLSLHKSFIKIERPKDDPGKGNYWAIEPGNEFLFLKERPARKSISTGENMPVMSARMEPSPLAPALVPEPSLPPPSSSTQSNPVLPPLASPQATLSMPLEPSSDATILLSDNAGVDESAGRVVDNDLPLEASLYSPLPANMRSSPPFVRHSQPNGTPPPVSRNAKPSTSRSHKRKFSSMDDSGYISSLESSATRPNHQRAMLLTSEMDRPRIKRGRAEEEIARLRGSSPYSPTKARDPPYGPGSSSPVRQVRENKLFPLTPVVKMHHAPPQPPPSASPNTNLRNHRDKVRSMLQSPLRRVAGLSEEVVPWSPAFRLEEALYNLEDYSSGPTEFDIFQDLHGTDENVLHGIGSVEAGSPVKRSAKRAFVGQPPIARTPSVLSEITNSALKRPLTSAPFLKLPDQSPSQFFDTPSKVFSADAGSPSKMLQESPCRMSSTASKAPLLELPGNAWQGFVVQADFSAGEVPDFSGGVDIFQGFQKIGANRGSKSGLGRSLSTKF